MTTTRSPGDISQEYPIPLYLNQRYVFDILAVMEDGFSDVQTITSNTNSEKSTATGGEIGLSNVFNLIGINLAAKGVKAHAEQTNHQVEARKIHTPSSLFTKMRQNLFNANLVRNAIIAEAEPGSFIELKVKIHKNPMLGLFEAIDSIMGLVVAAESNDQRQKNKPAKGNKQIKQQFEQIFSQLKGKGTTDIFAESLTEEDVKIVLTIEPEFLGDPSMSDLIDGDYTVIGKVSKVIKSNEDPGINLLRKTSLASVQKKLLDQLFASLEEVKNAGFDFPNIETEIKGPAMQIIPIAIFV
jgi:hypothetical protein